jgi:hypothetical protein
MCADAEASLMQILLAQKALIAVCAIAVVAASGCQRKDTPQPAAHTGSGPSSANGTIEEKPAQAKEKPAPADAVAEAQAKYADLFKWKFETETDKMTGAPTRFAFLAAKNELNFSSPYSGGSRGDLMVRQRKGGDLMVMFSISKGQIVCDSPCKVRVRFDDREPVTFTANTPADYSSTSLFLRPAAKFVAELEKSKLALVEVGYYQSGAQVSQFETEGFTWGKSASK